MQLLNADCLDAMRGMQDNSVDLVLTDPPYGLKFMGKKWDCSVPSVEIWAECLRVLKPGGHVLAFAGTRTQHRMAVNIEDAGFEIRDMLAWVYGSGFPKSHDVSKAIDKAAGAVREVVGFDKSRHRTVEHHDQKIYSKLKQEHADKIATITAPATHDAQEWDGWGTALKPALEPITMARKPLVGTVAANVLEYGTGGLNIDACRVGTESITQHGRKGDKFGFTSAESAGRAWSGRFPANLIHDGSDEATQGMGDKSRYFYCAKASKKERDAGCEALEAKARQTMGSGIGGQPDQNKANNKNNHPTVKPIALMEYLCKLASRPGAVVLDPFMGSGTTGIACKNLGREFIGIERDPEYFQIASERINNQPQQKELAS